MSLSTPTQIEVPFADAGLRTAIPAASNNTTGRAGYDQGFPPINLTPKIAGGIPPFGQDMNGVLFDITTALQYLESGASFVYDSAFSTAIGGYNAGARVLRSDGEGYWLNTTDNNTTDPESAGAAAAGWVPDYTNGIAAITMTSSNVTLTPIQYGRPIIVITGTLTTNLNLVFPDIAGQWVVYNNTSGAFSITCKTSSGSGVVVSQSSSALVFCDAVNVYLATTDLSLVVLKTGSAMSGSLVMNGAAINMAQSSDIASASTINLDSATGNYVRVTGTVQIDNITLAQGAQRIVYFSGSLVLANGANLILPGAANIKTQSGDCAIFVGEAAGVVRCVTYSYSTIPSMVRLHTANGYGSTNTKIRRFSTVVTNQGTDITYADSATLGASFTINTPGDYAISYCDNFTGAGVTYGVSLNTTQPTTDFESITIADILSIGTNTAASSPTPIPWTGYLPTGSVIRPHTNGTTAGSKPITFTIARVR